MALMESVNLEMGRPAANFSLMCADGGMYGLEDFEGAKVLVIMFICNHCPYVQAIWERLVKLDEIFGASGVQFVAINPNVGNVNYEEESLEKMKVYAEKYRMKFPYLADFDQNVAREYDAQCTPDIYVYDGEQKLAYHGRLDDNWKDASGVEKEELAEAISILLEGGKPSGVGQKPSMGCSIKWL